MRDMFRGTSAFNQPLNNWNVSNTDVEHRGDMFNGSGISSSNLPVFYRQMSQPIVNTRISGVAFQVHNAFTPFYISNADFYDIKK
jgi:hypothetical protein